MNYLAQVNYPIMIVEEINLRGCSLLLVIWCNNPRPVVLNIFLVLRQLLYERGTDSKWGFSTLSPHRGRWRGTSMTGSSAAVLQQPEPAVWGKKRAEPERRASQEQSEAVCVGNVKFIFLS